MTVNDHDFMERLWSLEGDVIVFQFKLYQSCVSKHFEKLNLSQR